MRVSDLHRRILAEPKQFALEFQGVNNQYLELPDISSLFNTEASIVMLLKLNNSIPTAANTGILTIQSGSAASHYSWIDGLAYMGTFRNSRVESIVLSNVDRTSYHFLIITTKPGTDGWKMYQNKILVRSVTGQSIVQTRQLDIGRLPYIGWSRFSTPFYFDGLIKNIKLYNRALSQSEVNDIVDGIENTNNLVINYKLNDGSGCIASDSISSQNATLKPNCPTNSPIWSLL
jgi:hypothetical protein